MATSIVQSNPYIGPRAFQLGERIHGREHEANQLMNLIIAERIVLLHSPSGAGKSSLVQAGLFPRLKEEGFFRIFLWKILGWKLIRFSFWGSYYSGLIDK